LRGRRLLIRNLRHISRRLWRAPWPWKAAGGTLLLLAALAGYAAGGDSETAVPEVVQKPAPTSVATGTPTPLPPAPTPLPTPTPTPTPHPPTPTAEPAPPPPAPPAPTATPQPTPVPEVCVRYLSWVWQFSVDGPAADIATVLADHDLGIILKTHKGVDWMAKEDNSADAVSGPEQVSKLAQYFESRGVPFHAYVVPTGVDPRREAAMAADVLAAGARSIFLDLEPWQGYWQGTPEAASLFGRELRRLQPNGVVVIAIEPRPWALDRLPLAEFAAFSDALVPLIYWETFNTAPNLERFEASGWPPGPDGITPEFLLDVSAHLLQPYNLPIQPVGQGASPDMNAWARFLDYAAQSGMPDVSVWRHGVTNPGVWGMLKARIACG